MANLPGWQVEIEPYQRIPRRDPATPKAPLHLLDLSFSAGSEFSGFPACAGWRRSGAGRGRRKGHWVHEASDMPVSSPAYWQQGRISGPVPVKTSAHQGTEPSAPGQGTGGSGCRQVNMPRVLSHRAVRTNAMSATTACCPPRTELFDTEKTRDDSHLPEGCAPSKIGASRCRIHLPWGVPARLEPSTTHDPFPRLKPRCRNSEGSTKRGSCRSNRLPLLPRWPSGSVREATGWENRYAQGMRGPKDSRNPPGSLDRYGTRWSDGCVGFVPIPQTTSDGSARPRIFSKGHHHAEP